MNDVPRRPRRRAALERDDVLRCAATVIAERGIDRARFSDIATQTGLAVSTLNEHVRLTQGSPRRGPRDAE